MDLGTSVGVWLQNRSKTELSLYYFLNIDLEKIVQTFACLNKEISGHIINGQMAI